MNKDIYEKLKDIKIEDFAFLLLIVSGIVDMMGNEDFKKYYINGQGKVDARKKYILSSVIILIAFSYFVYRNYKVMKEFPSYSREYQYAKVRFFGSIFLVIGELMVLYYFINAPQLDDGF